MPFAPCIAASPDRNPTACAIELRLRVELASSPRLARVPAGQRAVSAALRASAKLDRSHRISPCRSRMPHGEPRENGSCTRIPVPCGCRRRFRASRRRSGGARTRTASGFRHQDPRAATPGARCSPALRLSLLRSRTSCAGRRGSCICRSACWNARVEARFTFVFRVSRHWPKPLPSHVLPVRFHPRDALRTSTLACRECALVQLAPQGESKPLL